MKRKDSKTMTIDMPPKLHKELKRIALESDTSMTAIVIAAIKRELAQPTATQDTRTGYAADGDG